MEEYLRRDVVGIVTDDAELTVARNNTVEVKFQEILLNDATFELRKIFIEVFHTFRVKFHYRQVMTALKQKLREHTHSGSHLNHRHADVGVESRCYAVRH